MQHPAKHYPVDEWEARDDFSIATKIMLTICQSLIRIR